MGRETQCAPTSAGVLGVFGADRNTVGRVILGLFLVVVLIVTAMRYLSTLVVK